MRMPTFPPRIVPLHTEHSIVSGSSSSSSFLNSFSFFGGAGSGPPAGEAGRSERRAAFLSADSDLPLSLDSGRERLRDFSLPSSLLFVAMNLTRTREYKKLTLKF